MTIVKTMINNGPCYQDTSLGMNYEYFINLGEIRMDINVLIIDIE